MLARTDPDAPKHRGISYFLVDMKTPGLTVKPLINMAGTKGFNELFFENVRVPRMPSGREEPRLVYGDPTLSYERTAIEAPARAQRILNDLVRYARLTKKMANLLAKTLWCDSAWPSSLSKSTWPGVCPTVSPPRRVVTRSLVRNRRPIKCSPAK